MNASISPAGKRLAIIGALLQFGMILGYIIAAIVDTQLGSLPKDRLAAMHGFGNAKNYMLGGMIIKSFGLLLIIIAMTAWRYRAKWLFWLSVIYGSLLWLNLFTPTLYAVNKAYYSLFFLENVLEPDSKWYLWTFSALLQYHQIS